MKKQLFLFVIFIALGAICIAATTTKKVEKKPDLVVTKVKATKHPIQKNKVIIEYSIKNQGNAASVTTQTGITPLTGSKKIQQTTAPIAPGQTTTQTCIIDSTKNGKYNISVSADYMNQNVELNEANNENTIKFSVGGKF